MTAPAPPQQAAAPVVAVVEPKRSHSGLIVAISALVFVILALAAYLVAINMKKPADGTADSAMTNAAIPTGTATAGAPAAGPMAGGEVLKYVTAAANIRNIAAAKGATVVGTLRRGEQVKGTMYQGLVPGTYWFKLADGRGYVSVVNLGDTDPGPAPPPLPTTRVPVAGATFCSVSVASGNLRIRNEPNGRVIGGMPAGARFQAYNGQHESDGSQWLMIQPVETRYPTGWVSGDYVVC
ncbi:MAG: SH3 domain-containing protein [Pseudomonadota bacterium]